MTKMPKKKIRLPSRAEAAVKEFRKVGDGTDPLGMYTGTPQGADGEKENNFCRNRKVPRQKYLV